MKVNMGIDRRLTKAERGYMERWIQMGFPDDTILLAYQRTLQRTGQLKWPYMHSILERWHKAGLHTRMQVEQGDGRRPGPVMPSGELGPEEIESIRRMMQKKGDNDHD